MLSSDWKSRRSRRVKLRKLKGSYPHHSLHFNDKLVSTKASPFKTWRNLSNNFRACEISYQSGRFDLQASEIKDQFREAAHQLTSNLTDIVGCVNSFQTSIDATNLDWKRINVRLAADSNKTSSSITTRRISSLQKSKITPVEILYNHLEHTI